MGEIYDKFIEISFSYTFTRGKFVDPLKSQIKHDYIYDTTSDQSYIGGVTDYKKAQFHKSYGSKVVVNKFMGDYKESTLLAIKTSDLKFSGPEVYEAQPKLILGAVKGIDESIASSSIIKAKEGVEELLPLIRNFSIEHDLPETETFKII